METDGPIQVLLIEDDPDDTLLVNEWLRDANGSFKLECADRLATGLSRLAQGGIDVLLLDLSLPDSHGIATVGRIQAQTNDIPIVILTGADDEALALEALGQGTEDYLAKAELGSRSLTRAIRYARERHRSQTALRETIQQLTRSEAELQRSQEETIHRLALAIELRDAATGVHVERMSQICSLLAEKLGLGPDHCRRIATASKLHDIGKIGIADGILMKPGPLSEHERSIIERHPEIGRQILTQSGNDLLDLAETIAWTHHERYDGQGYPRGIIGNEIPLEGRIAAVADVFDALLSDRSYRRALPLKQAFQLMAAGRSSHFDPSVLDVFFASSNEVLAISGHRATKHEPTFQLAS